MTIDEGIKNLEYSTEQLEMEIESGLWIKESESELCCKEGIALNKKCIEWLTELKEAKRFIREIENKLYLGTSFYPTSFLKENEKLFDKLTKGVEYLDD